MPNNNYVLSRFADKDSKLYKTTYVVLLDDYLYLRKVFPEWGFATAFPGFVMHALVKALKDVGIQDAETRDLKTGLPGLLTACEIAIATSVRDVHRPIE